VQVDRTLTPAAELAPSPTAAQAAIGVLGDAWTLRILRTVFRGQRRHSDFLAALGVSRAVLSDRLAKLTAARVLERRLGDGGHPQYWLSESGLDLWSLFLAMWQWESDWGTAHDPDSWAPDLPRPQLTHTGCGRAMRPELRCSACQAQVSPFETQAWQQAQEPTAQSVPASATSAPLFRRARSDAAGHGSARPAQRLIRVIGDRWNSAVVAAAFRGTRQFARFEAELRIAPGQLSARLQELQELGILRAQTYAGSRLQYRLTRAGIALFPITLELMRWGQRWLQPHDSAAAIKHLPCSQALQARWHCSACQLELARETVRFG
jgi:DNA-binding HxlR family transcriptional regulator